MNFLIELYFLLLVVKLVPLHHLHAGIVGAITSLSKKL